MYKEQKCLYFKCDYNLEINASTLSKLITAIKSAVNKFDVKCALNSCTTIYDLLFYKAVEACKVNGVEIKNLLIKYNGRGGRRFDEYIRIFPSKKSNSIDEYITAIGDVCINCTNGSLSIVETKKQMRRK